MVIWDATNPHPQLRGTPEEFIFAARGAWKGGSPAFNDDHAISGGLQECVLLFAGKIERVPPAAPTAEAGQPAPAAPTPTDFTTLIRSGPASGEVAYAGLLQRGPFGTSGLNPNRRPARTNQQQPLAARLTGGAAKVNALLVGDLDLISPTFFEIRQSGAAGLEFDNVTFILNAVDVLAGDESLVDLRKKRRQFRTLERLEERRREEEQLTQTAIDNAEAEANQLLEDARKRFDDRIKEIESRTDVDENTKRVMVESVRQAEQRKLDTQSRAIEDQKRRKIEDARLVTNQQIDRLQTAIRVAAVTIPPVPALLVGLAVLVRRRQRERASLVAREEPAKNDPGTRG